MTKKELTGFQKAIALITVASLLVYSIINLALVINAYTRLDSNVDLLGDIIDNWQTGTIQEITTAATCPSGYESVTKDRVWPGVKQGCWCGSVSSATLSARNITCGPFCDGACSTDARGVGCTDIAPKAQQPLTYYGQVTTPTSFSNQICVKRSTETWANTAQLSASGDCPKDSAHKCATSKGNLFCTKEAKCPITSIKIEIIASGAVAACTAAANCAILSNDGSSDIKRLVWTRGNTDGVLVASPVTEDAIPLSQFKLDEYSICSLKTQDNVTPNRPLFYLLDNKPTTCYSAGAHKWNSVDSYTEAKLFAANGLTSYISSLSTYTAPGMSGYYATSTSGATYTWNLFSRGYIPWAPACRDRMEPLIKRKSLVDDMRTSQLALMIIGIISSFFLGIPLAIMEIQNLRGVDLSCFDGKGEEERTKLKRFKKITTYIFKGIQLPFQIWAIVIAGSSKALFTDVAEDNCSNAETNANLAYLATTITKTYSSTVTALAILVATILLDLILEAWEKRKAKKAAQNTAAAPPTTNREEKLELTPIDNSTAPLKFGQSSPTKSSPSPTQPQAVSPTQPQNNAGSPNIVIQIQSPAMPQQQYPQQQYPQQQYPQQGYPPQQQYAPQGYPQQQQYPQQQYPQQGYPPQQQYAPQQYPQQGYPPQQQYPPRY